MPPDFLNDNRKSRSTRGERKCSGSFAKCKCLGQQVVCRVIIALRSHRNAQRIFNIGNLQELIRFTYPEGYMTDDVGERGVLCLTNAMVNEVNNLVLELLEGECDG